MKYFLIMIVSCCLATKSYSQQEWVDSWLNMSSEEWLLLADQELDSGNLVNAIRLYDLVIRKNPKPYKPYLKLGDCYSELGYLDFALVHYEKALEASRRLNGNEEDKRLCDIYFSSAQAYDSNNRHEEAIILYEKTIELDPEYPHVKNLCAWILATSHEPALLDAKRALELAKLECSTSAWKNPAHLITYAAAQAASGNFVQAVKWQNAAIELNEREAVAEWFQQHLKLYQRRLPYRQELVKPKPVSMAEAKKKREIEGIVRRYFKVTQSEYWDAITDMMHPEYLVELKEAILMVTQAVLEDKSGEELRKFLRMYRVKTFDELRSMTGAEFIQAMGKAKQGSRRLGSMRPPVADIESMAITEEKEVTIIVVKLTYLSRSKGKGGYATIFLRDSDGATKVSGLVKHSATLPSTDKKTRVKEALEASINQVKNLNNEGAASLIHWYIFSFPANRNKETDSRILRGIGERMTPMVLAILNDPSYYQRLVKLKKTEYRTESPFNRACILLGDDPPAEAVPAITPFLKDPARDIRWDAAMVLGKTGHLTSVPHLRIVFKDPDSHVRSGALIGIGWALERVEADYSSQLFPDVKRLLEEGKNGSEAARVLFNFDPDKAKEFFLSPKIFSPDSKILSSALKVLVDAQESVPRKKLLTMIEAIGTEELKYPQTYLLGGTLNLLGQHREPKDRKLLEGRMDHSQDIVAAGAAAGLLYSHGLEGFRERIWEAEKKSGYDSLSDHQRYWLAVFRCHYEINNGGMYYFLSSSGDHWKDALIGYKMMGFSGKYEALREALILFGDDGPPEDSGERNEQLSKLLSKDKDIFETLDDRYYDSPEEFEVIITRFVLANPESFR